MAMYHPMEDANHCFFRMILLSHHLTSDTSIETFRLMDFYCLFPSSLSDIKLPRQFSKYKAVINAIPKQFESIPNRAALFDKLRHIQNNSLGCLVSLGFFDRNRFLNGSIALTDQVVPINVIEKMSQSPIIREEWFKFLTEVMPNFSSDGPNGWKARTLLGEFRYDAK